MRPRRKASVLRTLDTSQKAEVLKRLLRHRPELRGEVERVAEQILAKLDVEKIAREIAITLVTCDADPGGLDDYGGYHEHGESVVDDLEEAVEPFVRDMKKRLKLGRVGEARQLCMAIVLGLYRASTARGNMGALTEEPTWAFEAAEEVIDVYRGRTSKSSACSRSRRSFPSSFWSRTGAWGDTLEW